MDIDVAGDVSVDITYRIRGHAPRTLTLWFTNVNMVCSRLTQFPRSLGCEVSVEVLFCYGVLVSMFRFETCVWQRHKRQ